MRKGYCQQPSKVPQLIEKGLLTTTVGKSLIDSPGNPRLTEIIIDFNECSLRTNTRADFPV